MSATLSFLSPETNKVEQGQWGQHTTVFECRLQLAARDVRQLLDAGNGQQAVAAGQDAVREARGAIDHLDRGAIGLHRAQQKRKLAARRLGLALFLWCRGGRRRGGTGVLFWLARRGRRIVARTGLVPLALLGRLPWTITRANRNEKDSSHAT